MEDSVGEKEVKIDVPEDGGQSNYTTDTEKLTLEKLTGAAGDTPEPRPGEPTGKPQEGVGGEPSAGKVAYSSQELEALLQSGSALDTSRLSLEGQALMKSFQKGFDQKFQQIADMKRRLESETQKSSDPREKIFRDYMQNPAQVISQINSEIRKLEMVGPMDERYVEARQTIATLNEFKDDLALKRQQTIESMRTQETTFTRAQTEILEAIPDFSNKREKLTDFAMEMGLSREEVMAISDPTLFGPLAVKVTKALNRLYDKVNAGKSAESKVNKEAPKPLARAGTGGDIERKTEKRPEDMSMAEYRKWRSQST